MLPVPDPPRCHLYSWVVQWEMSREGCRTKADTVNDFQMDVIFKMIPSSITKVDKVNMSSINKNESLSLSAGVLSFCHCVLHYMSTFRSRITESAGY